MTLRTVLTTAAFIASTIATSTAANAFVVDFDGNNFIQPGVFDIVKVNMGNVQVGQTGTINNFYVDNPYTGFGFADSQVIGNINGHSKMTLNYSITGLQTQQIVPPFGLTKTALSESTDYEYFNVNGPHGVGYYAGGSQVSTLGTSNNYSVFNATNVAQLIFATANLVIDTQGVSTGSLTITNNSPFVAAFNNFFIGILTQRANSGTLTYNVVSTVPLPASLPMFAAVIGGMFGLSRFRKRQYAA